MSDAQSARIPILTYHSIDDGGSVISTRRETFGAQMKFLSENGFTIVSLKTLGLRLNENKPFSPKTIVLTFDDGFQNFYTEAFPILNEYNFTATVFLITDYCGKYNDWSGNLSSIVPDKLMDWKEIKELSNYKIEFGAHSLTHPDLTKLTGKRAESEISQSKMIIEARLGAEVTDFAYPYGKYNLQIKRLAEKYYRTACSTRLGKVERGADLLSLKRLDAYYLSNERIFRSITSAKFDWYMGFRQTMRDTKAAWYSK